MNIESITNNLIAFKQADIEKKPHKYRLNCQKVLRNPQQDSFTKTTAPIRRITFQNSLEQGYGKKIGELLDINNIQSSGNIFTDLDRAIEISKHNATMVREAAEFLDLPVSKDQSKNIIEIYKAARTDKLTEVNNKRALFKDLEEAKLKLFGTGKPLSLAMFDFDNFKSINDLLGYNTGDAFIRTMAKTIKDVASENNFLTYRFGGEEFIVIMPNTDKEKASEIAKTITKRINDDKFLDSYMPTYLKEADRQIEKLEGRQKDYKELKLNLSKLDYLDEINEKYYANTALISHFNDALKGGYAKLKQDTEEKGSYMLEKAKGLLDSGSEKDFIRDCIKRISNGESFREIFNQEPELRAILRTYFDSQVKINAIKNWQNTVLRKDDNDKMVGFSVTAGVEEFTDLVKPVEDYIDGVGKMLSYGKRHIKGKVYNNKKAPGTI